MFEISLTMALPLIIIGALLIAYCWYDIARTDRPLLVPKWLWAVLVLVLVPIGPIAYLSFEKLGILQTPGSVSEELTTKMGGNLYFRGH